MFLKLQVDSSWSKVNFIRLDLNYLRNLINYWLEVVRYKMKLIIIFCFLWSEFFFTYSEIFAENTFFDLTRYILAIGKLNVDFNISIEYADAK